MKFLGSFKFHGLTLGLFQSVYAEGGIAWELYEIEEGVPMECYTTLSVYLPHTRVLPKDTAYVKHYSENEPVTKHLIKKGVLVKAPADVVSVSQFGLLIQAYSIDESKLSQKLRTTIDPYIARYNKHVKNG